MAPPSSGVLALPILARLCGIEHGFNPPAYATGRFWFGLPDRLQNLYATLLKPSETTSGCPWKGTAHYHSLVVDGKENRDAAWFYPDPKEAAAEIRDRIAFWKGVDVH